MFTRTRFALAAFAAIASLGAQAGASLNQPLPPGAVVESFSSFHGAVAGNSVLGGLGSLSGTGTVYREGAPDSNLIGANNTVGYYLVPGLSAQPFSATGNWLNIGKGQSTTVTFSQGMSYVGFLWGSVDTYNFIEIEDGESIIKFRGGNAGLGNGQVAAGDGNRFAEQFFAYSGNNIQSITFISTGTAFEVDNLAVVAVPEPGTYALMAAGLAAVGFMARRRRAQAA
jgi:hypothetical protein